MIPISIKGDLKEYYEFVEDFKKELGEFIAKGYIGNRETQEKEKILKYYDVLTPAQQSLYLQHIDLGFKNIEDLKSVKSKKMKAPSFMICEEGVSLLKKLFKNLDRIASANVDEMLAFIDEYQKEFPTVVVKGKTVIDKKSNIYESVKKIFVDKGYEMDKFKEIIWKASKVKVCPYCNRIYIPFISVESKDRTGKVKHKKPTDKEDSIKGQLDHFFPKEKYPYLAISLYNLIPSCTYCNGTSSKGAKDPLDEKIVSPFFLKSHTGLRFFIERFNEGIVDLDKCPESIELGIDVKECPDMANNERIFHLKDVYSAHRDIAADIIAKFREWSPKPYIDSVEALLYSQKYQTERTAVERRLRMYWGVPLTEDRLGERPISKFTLDLINDLIKKSKS